MNCEQEEGSGGRGGGVWRLATRRLASLTRQLAAHLAVVLRVGAGAGLLAVAVVVRGAAAVVAAAAAAVCGAGMIGGGAVGARVKSVQGEQH